jgi:hypothetical protein
MKTVLNNGQMKTQTALRYLVLCEDFGPEPGPQFRRTLDELANISGVCRPAVAASGCGFAPGFHTSFHSPARETLGGRPAPRDASISDHHAGR